MSCISPSPTTARPRTSADLSPAGRSHSCSRTAPSSEVTGGSPFTPARAGVSPRGKSDRYKHRIAFPIDKKKRRIVLLGRGHRVVEFSDALRGFPVHLLNYTTGPEAGFRSVARWIDIDHYHARGFRCQFHFPGCPRRQVFDRNVFQCGTRLAFVERGWLFLSGELAHLDHHVTRRGGHIASALAGSGPVRLSRIDPVSRLPSRGANEVTGVGFGKKDARPFWVM